MYIVKYRIIGKVDTVLALNSTSKWSNRWLEKGDGYWRSSFILHNTCPYIRKQSLKRYN